MSHNCDSAVECQDNGSNAEVMDYAHLDQYTLGDKALQSELLQLFRIQLKDQTALLMACEDKDTWESSAHMLKGAARAVGAWQIGAIAEQLEGIAFDAEAEKAAMLSQLLAANTAFEAEIAEHL